MCDTSASLRLCTCASSIADLKNYWVLYRFQGLRVMGRSVLSILFDDMERISDKEALFEAMNRPDVFDTEMDLQDSDRIELVFRLSDGENEVCRFEYKQGSWQTIPDEASSFMYNHKKFAQGKFDYP